MQIKKQPLHFPTAKSYVFRFLLLYLPITNLKKKRNVMLQFMAIGTTEIVLIVLAVVLLFGGKKIPELMKGIGQGVRSFKDGMKDVEKEINSTDEKKGDEKK